LLSVQGSQMEFLNWGNLAKNGEIRRKIEKIGEYP
jgi:hypothetical protein